MINITKGIIQEKLENHKFKVRVPLFENAGSETKFIVDAVLCYQPGNIDSYKLDDVVFVTFETNNISKAVILGKLYQGNTKDSTGLNYVTSLEVTNNAKLPDSTLLGNISVNDISNLFNDFQLLLNRVETIEEGGGKVPPDVLQKIQAIGLSLDENNDLIFQGYDHQDTLNISEIYATLDDLQSLIPYEGAEAPIDDRIVWIKTSSDQEVESESLLYSSLITSSSGGDNENSLNLIRNFTEVPSESMVAPTSDNSESIIDNLIK